MPKLTLVDIVGTKVQAKDGAFSVFGRDAAGRNIQVDLPLTAIRRLAVETRRAALVTPRASSLPPAGTPGEWGEVNALDVRTAVVGTLSPPAGPAVAIVFDHGQDTELAFRLPPAGATQLGNMLIKEGKKLKG